MDKSAPKISYDQYYVSPLTRFFDTLEISHHPECLSLGS